MNKIQFLAVSVLEMKDILNQLPDAYWWHKAEVFRPYEVYLFRWEKGKHTVSYKNPPDNRPAELLPAPIQILFTVDPLEKPYAWRPDKLLIIQ